MIYKIRERWIYENEMGERRKFTNYEDALEAAAMDAPDEDVWELEDEDVGDIA